MSSSVAAATPAWLALVLGQYSEQRGRERLAGRV